MSDPAPPSGTTDTVAESPAPSASPEPEDAARPPPPSPPPPKPSTSPRAEPPVESENEGAGDMEVDEDAAEAAPKAPPTPLSCYGARVYDGGHHDVGVFFVFRQEMAEAPAADAEKELKKDQVPIEEEHTAGDGAVKAEVGSNGTTEVKVESESSADGATPLGYRFTKGLKVIGGGGGGGSEGKDKVTGSDSSAAVQAYVELEKQGASIRRALGISALSKAEPEGDDSEEGGDDHDRSNVKDEGAAESVQCLALSNVEDNESIQGLIRNGGCTWLGTFGLPPVPDGEEEDEVLDLWPKRVVRFADSGDYGVLALDGKSDAKDPLVAIPPTESKGRKSKSNEQKPETSEGKEETAEEGARKAYALISQALTELRALLPGLPEPPAPSRSPSPVPEQSDGAATDGAAVNGSISVNGNGTLHNGSAGGADSEDENRQQLGRGKRVSAQMALRTKKSSALDASPVRKQQNGEKESGDGEAAVEGPREESAEELEMVGNNRNSGSRKRPRTDRGYPAASDDPMQGEDRVEGMGNGEARRQNAGRDYRDERASAEEPMEEDASSAEAGEMTVVAVRTSLLRNRADEGPNPDEGEWETMVRRFIRYVESLEPGPTQEELSLMFAAALDPTLVRMRAANALLIELAEECAMPERGLDHEDDEEEEEDYGGVRGLAGSHTGGFKVRLELDANEGDEPPPEGIEALLKTVGAARSAVEAAARARACVTAASDTLGGLHELKADYKRSLPPGPREPIQSIIGEEQARVRGYATAHEDIEAQRVHDLRIQGQDVGDAYRAVEAEPGWSSVRRQVDSFLRRFADYCGARLPHDGENPGLLGLDIATARRSGGGPTRL